MNKRDVENETREIIVENKLWCINVVLLIVDQIILGKERATVFSFPKEEILRKRRIKFVNWKNWEATPSSFICIKHFEQKYYRKGKNDKRSRITKTLKPVPIIFNPNIQTSQCSSSSHIISSVKVPKRSARKRIYQDDHYQSFMNYNLINKLSGIEESLSLAGFLFKENNHYVTFYKIEVSVKRPPEVTECIKIDKKLTCKALFQMLSISFTTVVSPRH